MTSEQRDADDADGNLSSEQLPPWKSPVESPARGSLSTPPPTRPPYAARAPHLMEFGMTATALNSFTRRLEGTGGGASYHLKSSTFENTRPGQQLSGYLLQAKSVVIRTKKRRFVKLDGHRLTVIDPESGAVKQDVHLNDGAVEKSDNERELILVVKSKRLALYSSTDEEFLKWYNAFNYVFKRLDQYYELGNEIGQGAFSVVHEGRAKETGFPVAVKIVQNILGQRVLNGKETEILARVNHPNIVKTYDVFETRTETYIVMEFMKGGQLYDVIAEAETFSEKTSREVLGEILLAIRYLHYSGIVHRDLKPENLLCARKLIPPKVKIADFGLSAVLGDDRGEMLSTLVGSPGYVAPELIQKRPYAKPVDMWAVGVIFHQMLTGMFPFPAKDTQEFLRAVREGPRLRGSEWRGISAEAKDLIRKLLCVDPLTRLTADQALLHPFFSSHQLSSKGIARQRRSRLHSSQRLPTTGSVSKDDFKRRLTDK